MSITLLMADDSYVTPTGITPPTACQTVVSDDDLEGEGDVYPNVRSLTRLHRDLSDQPTLANLRPHDVIAVRSPACGRHHDNGVTTHCIHPFVIVRSDNRRAKVAR